MAVDGEQRGFPDLSRWPTKRQASTNPARSIAFRKNRRSELLTYRSDRLRDEAFRKSRTSTDFLFRTQPQLAAVAETTFACFCKGVRSKPENSRDHGLNVHGPAAAPAIPHAGEAYHAHGSVFLLFVVLAPFTSHAAAIHDAAKNGDVPGLAAALDAGANVNEADKFATPLYHAVFKQHLGAAQLLIERGANANAGSKTGDPPLMAAVAKSNVELIKLLLANDADPNLTATKEAPLHVAVNWDAWTALLHL